MTPQEVLAEAKKYWDNANQTKRLTIAALVSLFAAILIGTWLWLDHTDYAIVYSGLSPQVGGTVIAELQKENVPFLLKDGGSIIEVPAADAARVRLQLAENGIPAQASSALWKDLQNEKLGTSSFVEHTTYLRALEGSLAKDIESIRGVEDAHVTLAIPQHTPFLETMPKPKAAVTVRLLPGVVLSSQQVFGITHLVASSIPGLAPADVTVVDQNGNALNAKKSSNDSSQILRLQQLVEAHYKKQILALLTPIVGGRQNLRVVVDAKINTERGQSSSVTYGIGHVVTASVQSEKSSGDNSNSMFGIPGALSNQPPGTPSAPITAPTKSTAPTLTLAEIQAMIPKSQKNDQRFRYLLDKTVAFQKNSPWKLENLSVSVLINGHVISSGGKATTATVSAATASTKSSHPAASAHQASQSGFTAQDLQSIQQMVQSAIYASAQNGKVVVRAFPFYAPKKPPALPWWKSISPWKVWNSIEWFVFGLIALFIFRKPIRSLFDRRADKRIDTSPDIQKEGVEAHEAGSTSTDGEKTETSSSVIIGDDGLVLDFSGVGEGRLEENMETIRGLIRTDSDRVVQVIREWLGDPAEGPING